jgi:ribosomal protein S27E
MVFAVQCPKCRKFMLVEDHERGKVVLCLLCRTPIRVGGGGGVVQAPGTRRPTPPPRR